MMPITLNHHHLRYNPLRALVHRVPNKAPCEGDLTASRFNRLILTETAVRYPLDRRLESVQPVWKRWQREKSASNRESKPGGPVITLNKLPRFITTIRTWSIISCAKENFLLHLVRDHVANA